MPADILARSLARLQPRLLHCGCAIFAAILVPCSGSAQQPLSDSVARLNRERRWEEAALIAWTRDAATQSLEERCALRLGGLVAFTRLGAYDGYAAQELALLDRDCARAEVVRHAATDLATLRAMIALPPLPATGIDFSGVDQFWRVAALLARDVEPSELQWRALMSSPGYRLSMMNEPSTRLDMELALRPSRRQERDSLLRQPDDQAARIEHLDAAFRHRADLRRFRDSLARAFSLHDALALAEHFLPPHATDGVAPPLVAFALFRDDAYSVDAGIVVDLLHAQRLGAAQLTRRLAHELHHSYLARLDGTRRPPRTDPAAALVGSLIAMRNEGIADLIDKPYPLTSRDGVSDAYARAYDAAYARTPEVIAAVDSVLTSAAKDSAQLAAAGARVQALLPAGGHPNGAYVAREIYETFGPDSLFPGVRNAFAFLRAYAAAERQRGHGVPFSAETTALLDRLERRYVAR